MNYSDHEALIEQAVERATDRIDAAFLRGGIDGAEYEARIQALSDWADARFAEIIATI